MNTDNEPSESDDQSGHLKDETLAEATVSAAVDDLRNGESQGERAEVPPAKRRITNLWFKNN